MATGAKKTNNDNNWNESMHHLDTGIIIINIRYHHQGQICSLSTFVDNISQVAFVEANQDLSRPSQAVSQSVQLCLLVYYFCKELFPNDTIIGGFFLHLALASQYYKVSNPSPQYTEQLLYVQSNFYTIYIASLLLKIVIL